MSYQAVFYKNAVQTIKRSEVELHVVCTGNGNLFGSFRTLLLIVFPSFGFVGIPRTGKSFCHLSVVRRILARAATSPSPNERELARIRNSFLNCRDTH